MLWTSEQSAPKIIPDLHEDNEEVLEDNHSDYSLHLITNTNENLKQQASVYKAEHPPLATPITGEGMKWYHEYHMVGFRLQSMGHTQLTYTADVGYRQDSLCKPSSFMDRLSLQSKIYGITSRNSKKSSNKIQGYVRQLIPLHIPSLKSSY